MNKIKSMLNYFSKSEKILWSVTIVFIVGSFLIFDRENYFTLLLSVLGATSLIFSAKGNPLGQLLMIIFGLLYGIISYSCAYYGEMITYMGMTVPMAFFSLISWLKNPYKGNKSQVIVNKISFKEILFLIVLTGVVTFIFYFILSYLNTANMLFSTVSVSTSFIAVYLTFRRSPWYAVGYAANDVVLIILWIMAAAEDIKYLSVIICFVAFLANDIYGFINWRKMYKKQSRG